MDMQMLWNTWKNMANPLYKNIDNSAILHHLTRRRMESAIQTFNVEIGSVDLIAGSYFRLTSS